MGGGKKKLFWLMQYDFLDDWLEKMGKIWKSCEIWPFFFGYNTIQYNTIQCNMIFWTIGGEKWTKF